MGFLSKASPKLVCSSVIVVAIINPPSEAMMMRTHEQPKPLIESPLRLMPSSHVASQTTKDKEMTLRRDEEVRRQTARLGGCAVVAVAVVGTIDSSVAGAFRVRELVRCNRVTLKRSLKA